MPCSRVTPSAVAYASTTLGATLLASVFGAFYVSVFAKHWGITQGWFQTAQAVYLVWNAVNDPLFGWLQDRPGSQQNNKHAYATAIMWGGPLFGLSFLLPWLPIGDLIAPFVGGRDAGVGIHCCLSLSLFDGMFTYCVLAQCGLFAELEASQEGRSLVLAASQAATALGGAALFVAYPLLPDHLRGTGADSGAGSSEAAGGAATHGAWMPGFILFAMLLAAVATACFAVTGIMVARIGEHWGRTEQEARAADGRAAVEHGAAAGPAAAGTGAAGAGAAGAGAPSASGAATSAGAASAPEPPAEGDASSSASLVSVVEFSHEQLEDEDGDGAQGLRNRGAEDRPVARRARLAGASAGGEGAHSPPAGGGGALARRSGDAAAAGELAARDRYDGSGAGGDDDDEDDDDDAGASGGASSRSCGAELAHVASTWLQILSSPSFCLFVACNFLQVFNNTFNSALHAAAMPAIFRGAFSDAAVGAMLGAGAVLAPLISIALTPLLLRVGHSYPLIRGAFAGKVLFALAVGAAVGSAAPGIASDGAAWWASGVGLAALFMVLHRALANVTFGWFPLAVSDIIDADKAAYRRQRRLGTSVFGLNAMIVKPAESLAPMLFAPVLHDFAAAAADTASSAAAELAPVSGWWSSLLWLLGDPTPADGEVNEAHRAIVAWRLVWGVPAVCGAIQLALWSFYKLRGKADTSVQPASGSKPGERVPEPVRGASV